jgi:predicted peptidase
MWRKEMPIIERYERTPIAYAIYQPSQIITGLPLILFLHGGRGSSQYQPTDRGLAPAIHACPERWNAIVVMPRAPIGESWRSEKNLDLAYDLLAEIETEFCTDSRRLYVTGLSSGGVGAWKLACRYPHRFAAIVAVAAGYDPFAIMDNLFKMPIWIFHGTEDDVVPVSFARAIVDGLRITGSTLFHYTEFPDVGHEDWEQVYEMPELSDWLFRQRRAEGAG